MLRRIGRGAGAICGLLAIALTGGSADAIHVSSSNCRPVGSKTLATDAHARIYSLPLRGPNAERDPEGVRVFGCLFGKGHSRLLGTTLFVRSAHPAKGTINAEAAAVAVPFAAYSTTFQGVDFNRVWAIVRNLRTNRVVDVAEASPPVGVEHFSQVTDIVVANPAAVAWISKGRSLAGGRRSLEVAASVPGQPTKILEVGGGIGPHSLELHGNQLTWMNEGVQHSAEMP